MPSTGGRGRVVLFFVGLCGLGAICILFPDAVLYVLALGVVLAIGWWAVRRLQRAGLELWQIVLVFTLSCYMVLNYGFENIAIHLGPLPFVVSYALMYGCLGMALYANRTRLASALKEPAMICITLLIFLSSLHLISDIPTFGVWAFRDSTLFLDGMFFILGLFWAFTDRKLKVFLPWMFALFVVNMLYGYTFPWSDRILAASPTSGVFMQVPIFGNYHQTAMDLLIGAAFCMGLARFLVKRRQWILHILVAAQILGLAILQSRATYIALAAYLMIFLVLREGKKAGALLTLASMAIVALILVTISGVEINGRIGPVSLSFLEDHLRSITGEKVTAASSVESRVDFAGDVMRHIRAHPIVGEGFGQPLIDYIDEETGAVVRVPHNSHLTVMARLGFIGAMVWLSFNACLLLRFAYAYRHRKFWEQPFGEFALWGFLYYVVFMIESLVEGPLEVPATAIPFYFFLGLTAGVIRMRMAADRKSPREVAAPVKSLERWSPTGVEIG